MILDEEALRAVRKSKVNIGELARTITEGLLAGGYAQGQGRPVDAAIGLYVDVLVAVDSLVNKATEQIKGKAGQ